MGAKDRSEKLLEDYTDVFQDIVNVLAFNGERLLKEKNLIPGPTASIYKDAYGKSREQFRDVTKFDQEGEAFLSLIGFENQTDMDKDMVFRVMGYDYTAYRRQIDSKESYRYPVFTLLLYFGTSPWTAARTTMEALSDTMSYGKYLPGLVSNVKLNVIEVAFLPEDIRKRFTSDFRIIADYFCALREKREEDFLKDERTFDHVEEMLDFFKVFAKDQRFEKFKEPATEMVKRGEKISMCTLFDVAEEKGLEKGLEKGIKIMISTLRELGWSDEQVSQKIQEKFQLQEETVNQYL